MSGRLFVFILAALILTAVVTAEPLDLITGLNNGQLWAEFHGAGDRAVSGVIGRTGPAPLEVNIPAGTQFWAQAGGRQGQATFGSRPVDLRDRQVARVTLHTCCTNIGLPEATAADLMLPVACPDVRLARLLGLPGLENHPHMAVQTAVWAIANDPRGSEVRRVVRKEPGVGSAAFASEMIAAASDLLRAAGLDPQGFRLFR
jgi:hypothetical protein